MKAHLRKPLYLLAIMGLLAFIIPRNASAQCPSVMGTGDPAVILMNFYGLPNVQYFADGTDDIEYTTSFGAQIGAIFSPKFQLVSGAEFSWVSRNTNMGDTLSGGPFDYRTFFLEIPLDMRMRLGHSKGSEGHFILGAGFNLGNMRETTDDNFTTNEMFFHQIFIRTGFEHTITVKDAFNVLWGLLLKADPMALADQDISYLNGSYFAGLKVGIQLGL